MLSLREAKSWSMPLTMENYAKKVRVTLRIKSCIPSSSNFTRIINVLKIGSRFFSDQGHKEAPLDGEHMRKKNYGLVIRVT